MPRITYPWPYFFFNYKVVPSAITRPLDIMRILSDTHSASYMLWVVIRTVCLPRIAKMSFQVKRRTLASMPVVGSSRITSLGSPIMLKAKERRRRIPPEKVLTIPFIFFSKLTDSKHLKIFCSSIGNPLSLWNISICSPAVISSHKISN